MSATHDVSLADGEAVKRFRATPRDEHVREWRALQLLARWAPGLAPRPLRAELSATPPVITMSRVPGQPLGGVALDAAQRRAVLAALGMPHALPRDVLETLPSSLGHPTVELPRVRRWIAQAVAPPDDGVVALAVHQAGAWLRSADADRLVREQGSVVFGHSDHNMHNFLWDGARVRLVDFEDSGRSDLATELADLCEHVAARGIRDHDWSVEVAELSLSAAERDRLRAARRLKATYWLLAFLTDDRAERRRTPEALRAQGQRVLGLL